MFVATTPLLGCLKSDFRSQGQSDSYLQRKQKLASFLLHGGAETLGAQTAERFPDGNGAHGAILFWERRQGGASEVRGQLLGGLSLGEEVEEGGGVFDDVRFMARF